MSANAVLTHNMLPKTNLWENRRASIRHQSGRGVSGRVIAATSAMRSAAIVNVSQGGVALRLTRRLRKGTKVFVRLNNPSLELSYDLAAHVAHAFKRPDGKWIIGFEFTRTLTSQELATLL